MKGFVKDYNSYLYYAFQNSFHFEYINVITDQNSLTYINDKVNEIMIFRIIVLAAVIIWLV